LLLIDLMNGPVATRDHDPSLAQVEILGLTADSRRVRSGYLFAALPGTRIDGTHFIPDAVARGAVAVLADPKTHIARPGVALVVDANPRRRLALMAARFYGRQPRTIAAVTGTSGKTSVAWFARQIWSGLGFKAASLGTLGLSADGFEAHAGLTTPDPVELHKDLAELAQAGIDHLALEASSHGLDQYRLDGVEIGVAGFTNLGRDHLDYHPTISAYFAAKRRLFSDVMAPGGVAVLNADAPEFAELANVARAKRHRILSYGARGDDLRLEGVEAEAARQTIHFAAGGKRYDVSVPLVGAFQAHNLLCALGLVIGAGDDAAQAVAALAHIKGVPGRMQRVASLANGAAVFVDYAHKPEALETMLTALRPYAKGELVLVFGCGGDRDKGKRPEMGVIAHRLADRVIVTDDNPRNEDPAEIRRQILLGCPDAEEIGDRAAAIEAALRGLGPGDLLVIAGKGHETGQIFHDSVLPFDDAEVARTFARTLGGSIT
jgi:UDP-N-acetylmuramoyl-L-alanyl-D-glutamate--2,6-diaminopimelate ligase